MININEKETIWFQKYRPIQLSDCILPEKIMKVARDCIEKRDIPNILMTGSAGIGKTSLARAMLNELGYDSMFINASKDNGIDTLRNTIVEYASSVSFSGSRKYIILDEMDRLSAAAQDALRGSIESFSSNCGIIGTANYKNRISDPLISRFVTIDFSFNKEEKKDMMRQTIVRCTQILKNENIQYDLKVLAEIVNKKFPDIRKIINDLQKYSSNGMIDSGILSVLQDNIDNLLKYLKLKEWKNMRKWVAENSDEDFSIFAHSLYEKLENTLTPETIPAIIMIINKYDYQNAFVVDKELNLIAMLTEIMSESKFK